jgi:hypothetical protein
MIIGIILILISFILVWQSEVNFLGIYIMPVFVVFLPPLLGIIGSFLIVRNVKNIFFKVVLFVFLMIIFWIIKNLIEALFGIDLFSINSA